MPRIFIEPFDQPMRGWGSYPATGCQATEIREGCAITRGPWWVDYNHAPPGGGYIHLLYVIHTYYLPECAELYGPLFGRSPLADGGYPTDYRNARITCRLKGNLTARGASLVILAQGKLKSSGMWVNQVLAAQPFAVSPTWSEQTITLAPDQKQWVQLGSRHDRADFYAEGPIEELLADLNADLIFVLFPLDIVPRCPLPAGVTNMHLLRAADCSDPGCFEYDRRRLPDGEVRMDTFKIEFAPEASRRDGSR